MKPLLGLRDPIFALSLTAIDPGLKGVLIGGPPGTGKSMIARAARALWPPDTPFVNLPLSCTMDRLLGGVNPASWQNRELTVEPGLLARADGGVLFVDEINLLPTFLLNALLQAFVSGEVVLERDGVFRRYPARFTLIGTFNPAEAPRTPVLRERVAFTVFTRTLNDAPTRVFIARNAGRKYQLPEDIIETVRFGRKIIGQVKMTRKSLTELCAIASRTGVEGNLSEIFAVRCAKANAALHRRTLTTQGDLDLAVRLIYLPRVGGAVLPGTSETAAERAAERLGNPRPEASTGEREKTPGNSGERTENTREFREGRARKFRQKKGDGKSFSVQTEKRALHLELPGLATARARPSSGGRHIQGVNYLRGRHIRSVPGTPGQGRIDALATLKAAALNRPFRQTDLPVTRRPLVSRNDFRIKQFRKRTGLLFVFAVDASGSMAINRLQAAKGAAISMLQDAYIYRDKIALINFCHQRAQILLAPGEGIAKAGRVLRKMPAGGRTPLPAALVETSKMASLADTHLNVAGSVLVLITDGRANQPLKPPQNDAERKSRAREEVQLLAAQVRKNFLATIVIDTRKMLVPGGSGQQLARWLGAHYVYLPRSDMSSIARLVKSEARGLRN